jgi:hypothetical protein
MYTRESNPALEAPIAKLMMDRLFSFKELFSFFKGLAFSKKEVMPEANVLFSK